MEEHQTAPPPLPSSRARYPLCLVTSDLPTAPIVCQNDEDSFEPTGFITTFLAWLLEPYPVFAPLLNLLRGALGGAGAGARNDIAGECLGSVGGG
ncbi:hypothetical protein OROMI_022848 [Orobanche minor]